MSARGNVCSHDVVHVCVCVCFCLCPQVCCWMSMCVPGVCLSVFGIFFSIATTAANFISIYSMPKFDRRRHTHFPHKTSNVSNILIWRIFIDDFLPPRSRLSPRDCIAAKKKERLKHIYAEQKKCQTEWTEKHFSRVESGRTEVSRYEILKVIFQSMVLHYSQIVWPWVRKKSDQSEMEKTYIHSIHTQNGTTGAFGWYKSHHITNLRERKKCDIKTK